MILLRGKYFRHRNGRCDFNSIYILYLCSKVSTNWVFFQALAQNSELRERLSKIHTESQIAEAAAVNVSSHMQVGDSTPPITLMTVIMTLIHFIFSLPHL